MAPPHRLRIETDRAVCALCGELADCAVFLLAARNDLALCALCCLDGAMIAKSRLRRARPHRRPCSCAECCAHDRSLYYDPETLEAPAPASPLDADLAARARGLEIDP